jgi:hypothetical protein
VLQTCLLLAPVPIGLLLWWRRKEQNIRSTQDPPMSEMSEKRKFDD